MERLRSAIALVTQGEAGPSKVSTRLARAGSVASSSAKSYVFRGSVHQHGADSPGAFIRRELANAGVESWSELTISQQVKLARRVAEPYFVILPTSKFAERWDTVMLLVLLYTCLVTPFQVAFVKVSLGVSFGCDRLVDLLFLFDMVVQSHTAYRRSNRSGDGRVIWVTSLRSIRWRYATSWLVFDIISVGSSIFDVLAVTLSSDDLRRMQVLRIIRVFRLLKLFSVVKGARITSRFVGSLELTYSFLELLRWTVWLCFSAHLIACIWGLVGLLSEDFNGVSWLTALEVSKGRPYDRGSPFPLYGISLYWALMTITSIGYGDISAQTIEEYLTAAVLMLAGGILWTRVIGSAIAAIGMLDADRMAHEQRMDSVLLMCQDRDLPKELRTRLRGYFKQSRRTLRTMKYRELTQLLSPALRGEVALRVMERHLARISFLRHVEEGFVVALAKALIGHFFPPNERILPEVEDPLQEQGAKKSQGSGSSEGMVKLASQVSSGGELMDDSVPPPLTILEQGLATRGRLLCAGSHWHEDMILSNPALWDRLLARSLNFCSVYTITRAAFLELLDPCAFPKSFQAVRISAVKVGMRRTVAMASHATLQRMGTLSRISKMSGCSLEQTQFARAMEEVLEKVKPVQQVQGFSRYSFSDLDESTGVRTCWTGAAQRSQSLKEDTAILDQKLAALEVELKAALRSEGSRIAEHAAEHLIKLLLQAGHPVDMNVSKPASAQLPLGPETLQGPPHSSRVTLLRDELGQEGEVQRSPSGL